jgi:hypothetical protein
VIMGVASRYAMLGVTIYGLGREGKNKSTLIEEENEEKAEECEEEQIEFDVTLLSFSLLRLVSIRRVNIF